MRVPACPPHSARPARRGGVHAPSPRPPSPACPEPTEDRVCGDVCEGVEGPVLSHACSTDPASGSTRPASPSTRPRVRPACRDSTRPAPSRPLRAFPRAVMAWACSDTGFGRGSRLRLSVGPSRGASVPLERPSMTSNHKKPRLAWVNPPHLPWRPPQACLGRRHTLAASGRH